MLLARIRVDRDASGRVDLHGFLRGGHRRRQLVHAGRIGYLGREELPRGIR